MLKEILRLLRPNPLDRLIDEASARGQSRFLLFWNRGLGDIALGLYAIVERIRRSIPAAQITFLTRPNLKDGFSLLGGVEILIAPSLKRTDTPSISSLLDSLGISEKDYDVVIESPNPTKWVSWQLGKLTPKLEWNPIWDELWTQFDLDPEDEYIGAHVQTETDYAHWRNWPDQHWQTLFEELTRRGKKVLLFGFEKKTPFEMEGVVDLRGKTELFTLLSIIRHRCSALVVPDSGISSMVYYLNTPFPIRHISLWAEPNMGILKQNVPSPNPYLQHVPLMAKNRDLSTILPLQVYEHIIVAR